MVKDILFNIYGSVTEVAEVILSSKTDKFLLALNVLKARIIDEIISLVTAKLDKAFFYAYI